MRIFVTGMTGFLGDQLSTKLLERGHKLGTLARNVASADRAVARRMRCQTARSDERASLVRPAGAAGDPVHAVS